MTENGHSADPVAESSDAVVSRAAVYALLERVRSELSEAEEPLGDALRSSCARMNCAALMDDDEEWDPRSAPKAFAYQPGDVVVEETPFAAVVHSEVAAVVCHHCWRRENDAGLLKRCTRCHFARYCGEQCAKAAWKTHKLECGRLAEYCKDTGLLPDGLIRLLNLVLMKVQAGQTSSPRGACHPPTERSFHSLCSHTAEIDKELKSSDKFQRNMLEIKRFLGPTPAAAPLDPALLAETYSRVLTNTISIPDRLGNTLGLGLYLGVSQFDHSCLPNAVYFCRNGAPKLCVVATNHIHSVKEVRISYVNPMKPTTERRAELKESYYFVCQCGRCQGVENDGMGRALTCKKAGCDGYILLGKDWKPMGPCPLCEEKMGARDVGVKQGQELMLTVVEFIKQHEANFTGEINGKRPTAEEVHMLLSLSTECGIHLFRLNYYRSRLHMLLANYYLLIHPDAEKALPVLDILVDVYEFYLGPVSMALCETLMKSAKAHLSLEQWATAAEKAGKAWPIIKLLYAEGDPFVREVQSILEICLERGKRPGRRRDRGYRASVFFIYFSL
ncbi:uncharacterized protein LOC129582226 [Paramacrobiotus metropolitanus]|uniref:uncharacterized protein LOC129582226 n=1 Tax=Paramacrobiotus metropolitanus TaxID=2943436 RepID=UPI002445D12F|nr:uncharacterized protein LOC129582226 [Paramacrobiotus metropolitanus]